ncbi:delta 8-sphingoloid desaturase protein [Exidia glandulosa HHB12029]|uniref:Delta 8-(E)-sphingolipid desaturase n=1 Tax=Exidia glandulosa HHB12029 TaxID=1314781 RepID=A0A165L2X6_EXIGL|nr:delta 8-sphingoloid desaturase protein [Exidia glandulosa HHB12029]
MSSPGAERAARALPLWTRDDVAQRVLAGETVFIRHGRVIRIPAAWLDKHPGGALAILHFVGRDASDESDAYHDDKIQAMIDRYTVARVDIGLDGWEPLVPPVASGWLRRDGHWTRLGTAVREGSEILLVAGDVESAAGQPTLEDLQPGPSPLDPREQRRQSLAYQELHRKVEAAGLYQCRYISGYGPEVVRYVLLAVLSAVAYRAGWFVASAVFLGFFWHQLTFTAHDLGHLGVTHNWVLDRTIGTFIADVLGGLSIGWWVDNHNIHHLVTNHPSHDPDIEHIPFFAISTHFLRSLHSSYYDNPMPFDAASRIFLGVQDKLFYIVMGLARFNLYALSYGFLWRARPVFNASGTRGTKAGRWTYAWIAEVACLALYWTWYSRVLIGLGSWQRALVYALVSHVVASPLHVQIVLSHFSRSTEDLGPVESFPHRQLRTTADVACPSYLAFLHGGLHLQVTHHLFPRLPRHNLKAASKLVKEFAKEQGLEYAEFGTFVEGNRDVLDVLADVAKQVAFVRKVARAEVDEALAKVRVVTPAQ